MTWVFVGGAERSGTTLLRAVLCQAAGVHPAIGEDRFTKHIAIGFADILAHWDRHGRDYFTDRKDARQVCGDMLRGYLGHMQVRWPGTEHVVMKEPALTRHLPAVAALLPEALFVVAVRDPRDIAASLLAVGERQAAAGEPMRYRRDMTLLGRYIMDYYAPALRAAPRLGSKRLAWMRYEELARQPVDAARDLARFTGLDLTRYDPAAAWPGWDDGRVDHEAFASGHWRSDLWGEPVRADRVGAWRQALTDEEAAAVAAACRPLMRAFGYDKTDSDQGSGTT